MKVLLQLWTCSMLVSPTQSRNTKNDRTQDLAHGSIEPTCWLKLLRDLIFTVYVKIIDPANVYQHGYQLPLHSPIDIETIYCWIVKHLSLIIYQSYLSSILLAKSWFFFMFELPINHPYIIVTCHFPKKSSVLLFIVFFSQCHRPSPSHHHMSLIT